LSLQAIDNFVVRDYAYGMYLCVSIRPGNNLKGQTHFSTQWGGDPPWPHF